jgi:hypothetical protein
MYVAAISAVSSELFFQDKLLLFLSLFLVVYHLGETGWGRQTSVIMYVDFSLCKVTEIK